jgi:hypothetical protein
VPCHKSVQKGKLAEGIAALDGVLHDYIIGIGAFLDRIAAISAALPII